MTQIINIHNYSNMSIYMIGYEGNGVNEINRIRSGIFDIGL
jgi:hypothetical protein